MLRVSLLHGAIPYVVAAVGLVGLGWLLAARGRTWWLRWVPVAVVAAAVLTAGIVIFVEKIWQPFPDTLPIEVRLSIAVGLLGLLLAGLRVMSSPGWWRKAALPVCAMLVLVGAMSQVNIYYGQFPTPGALLGVPLPNQVSLTKYKPATTLVSPPPGQGIAVVWKPPPGMPTKGKVAAVTIPGNKSGFKAKKGMVYLPPAYELASYRAKLPVLVMMAGTPGDPTDWFTAGDLAERVDRWALAHKGLAPIVVVADIGGEGGGPLTNPLCMDSDAGNVATYLDVDVPAWITTTLQVDTDHKHWGIGGLSSGATCAFQTMVRSPKIYPSMASLSGQEDPNLATHEKTVRLAFGGSEAAFNRVSPMTALKSGRKLPGAAALLTVGVQDTIYGPQQQHVLEALHNAGVPAELQTIPGEHNWSVFAPGLDRALDWIAPRFGLA